METDNIEVGCGAPPVKTYMLQFLYEDGNGWAFVNANTPNQANAVFKTQTKYQGAEVLDTREVRYYGDNMQLVYEGVVTTAQNSGNRILG